MEFWYIIEISFLLNIAYRELKSPRWKEEFSNRYSAYFDKFVSTVSVNENILKNEEIYQPEGRQFLEGLEKGGIEAWEHKFFISLYYRNFICKEWSKKITGGVILIIIAIVGILYFYSDNESIKNIFFVCLLFFSVIPLIFSFFDSRCYRYLFGDNQRIAVLIKAITRKRKSVMDADVSELKDKLLK